MSDKAIADLADTSPQSVYVARSEKRRSARLPIDKQPKALRLYAATLNLIGDALGIEPETLHRSYAKLLFKDLSPENIATVERVAGSVQDHSSEPRNMVEEITSEPNVFAPLEQKAPTEEITREPEPAPMMQMRPKSSPSYDEAVSKGMVTLKNQHTGEFLNLNGTAATRVKDHAYRGTITQAKAMRASSDAATGMTIVSYQPKAGNHQ